MEKLELKHLAPYLPYGLKIQFRSYPDPIQSYNKGHKGYLVSEELTVGNIWRYVETGHSDCRKGKPILRPLTDLTKEIVIDGYEEGLPFNPSEALAIHLFKKHTQESILNFETDGIPYWVITELFRWHFDVFGLIDKGLAIDINTLTP